MGSCCRRTRAAVMIAWHGNCKADRTSKTGPYRAVFVQNVAKNVAVVGGATTNRARKSLHYIEAPIGIEPMNSGFAGPVLPVSNDAPSPAWQAIAVTTSLQLRWLPFEVSVKR